MNARFFVYLHTERTGKMTIEEQNRMSALEVENAKLRGENSELQERLLAAQKTLAKYTQMLFGQKTERKHLPEKPVELTGSLFEQELDPEEQARPDREAARAAAEQDKAVHVASHERKVRKPIDTDKLEVMEEHIRPELDNEEDYVEIAPRLPIVSSLSQERCTYAGSSATSMFSRAGFRLRIRTTGPSSSRRSRLHRFTNAWPTPHCWRTS